METNGLIQLERQLNQGIRSGMGAIPNRFSSNQLFRYIRPLLYLYGIRIVSPNFRDMNPEEILVVQYGQTKFAFPNWAFGDYLQRQAWEFNSSFVDGLTSYYGESFRLGMANIKVGTLHHGIY